MPVFQTLHPLQSPASSRLPDIRPSTESAAIARAPQSFQHLVSFTERGFEPATLVIKKGQTVRFTNNTPQAMMLVGSDTPFTSPFSATSRDYVEITFKKAGEYSYSDTETKRAGVVHAE